MIINLTLNKIKIFFGFFLLLTFTTIAADIIPSARRVDWAAEYAAGQIGATIITRSVGSNLTGIVSTDGSTDNSAIINSALNLAASNTAVLLPAGLILITNEITLKSYKTLRGAGQSNTVLVARHDNTNSSMWWLKATGTGITPDYTNTVNSTLAKGDTNMTLATMGGVTNGAIMLLDHLNFEYLTNGVAEGYDYLSRDDGSRLMGQMIEVLSVDGNDITFRPPLSYWYTNTPQLCSYRTIIKEVGVENLMLTNATSAVGTQGVGASTGGRNLYITVGANCWVKNVSFRNVVQYHVLWAHMYRGTIRDSDFYGSMVFTSGRGYGIDVGYRSTACLIENNWAWLTRPGFIVSGAGPWNVFAHNFGAGTYSDQGFIPDFLINHGGAPHMTLWEGNVGNGLNTDMIHAGANTLTVYRSYFRGWQPNASDTGTNDYQRAIAVLKGQWEFNIVGNVLGDPTLNNLTWSNYWTYESTTNDSVNLKPYIWRLGFAGVGFGTDDWSIEVYTNTLRSDNFTWSGDDGTNVFDVSGEPLPNSLYLASKPEWFGNLDWPAIGPTMSGIATIHTRSNLIPAQARFYNINYITNESIKTKLKKGIQRLRNIFRIHGLFLVPWCHEDFKEA